MNPPRLIRGVPVPALAQQRYYAGRLSPLNKPSLSIALLRFYDMRQSLPPLLAMVTNVMDDLPAGADHGLTLANELLADQRTPCETEEGTQCHPAEWYANLT